ncbi:unnamed protein product, partial [Lymnaea stagnalis]
DHNFVTLTDTERLQTDFSSQQENTCQPQLTFTMLTSPSHLVVLACILAHGSALTQRLTYKSNENIGSFSPDEIQAILHAHNAYRSVIKPTAKYMAEVVWDEDIAAYAQDWANNCTGTHRA